MPKKAIDYSKTIIYKLIKNDDFDNANIYVGSTTDFIKRKSQHKRSCCNENDKSYNFKVYQNIRENGGWEEWKMIEIEKYPCNDSNEAHAREEYWKCELNANLNMIRAFRTEENRIKEAKEYIKQYQVENAEKIKEYKKQYQLENAEKLKEQQKIYYTENAEKITERVKQYRIENAEKVKERAKQYYTENAEKVKEYLKQYRIDNANKLKQKYDCSCGGKYTHKGKSTHEKTNKHQNYLKTISI